MPKPRACDSCRQKKIQCDRALPKCNWCWHHGLSCSYDGAANGHVTKSSYASGQNLSKRIEQIELAFSSVQRRQGAARLLERQDPKSRESHWKPLRVGLSEIHFAGQYMCNVSASANALPTFSEDGIGWIRLRTGQEPAFPPINVHGLVQEQAHPVQKPSRARQSPDSHNLPSRDTLEHALNLYFSSHFYMVFPLIDPVLFRRTLERAYSPENLTSKANWATAKACVFSFMAIVALLRGEWVSLPPMDGTMFESMSRNLLPQVLSETTLESSQATFMLCFYHFLSGRQEEAGTFHGISARIVMALGASYAPEIVSSFNHRTAGDERQRTNRHLRRLFWLSYVIDKQLALQTGHVPYFDDDYCDLRLPGEDAKAGSPETRLQTNFWVEMADEHVVIPGDLRLILIMSKMIKSLYSASALRLEDTELLKNIRELDNELETWRLSVPEPYRPSLRNHGTPLSRSPGMDAGSIEKFLSIRRSVPQHKYYYLLAAIHVASGRCKGWYDGEDGNLAGVSSSIAISIEASRSLILHLRANVHCYMAESFWMAIFYPLSAAIYLFYSILLDPADHQAQGDLRLISSVPQTARNMRSHCVTAQDENYLRHLESFVAELVRLGNCAVARTKMEQEAQDSRLCADTSRG